MSPSKARVYSACDKAIEYLLYTLVFFIPTSKSVVEVFATLAIAIWLYKNGLRAWEWVLEKKRSLLIPGSTAELLKILVPAGIAAALLVYSSVMISLAVISHHFGIESDLLGAGTFILITLLAALLIAVFLIIVLAVVRSDFGLGLKAAVISYICVSVVTSAFTSQNPGLSSEALLFKVMEYLLIFLIMADVINTPRRLFNLVASLLIAAFFVGLDGLYQRVAGYDLFRRFPLFEEAKITASFTAPNGFAAYLAAVLPLPLALIAFNVTTLRRRFGLFALSLVLAVCLLLTFTRGAWLGFFAGFLLLFLFAGMRRFVTAIVIFALLVSLATAFAPAAVKSHLGSLAKIGTDLSSADRLIIWKTGWKMFMDMPLFGHGLGTFMSVFERYRPAGYNEIVYAHNCFLQMAAETGIMGLLAFLWLCASVILRAFSRFLKSSDNLIRAAALGAAACVSAFLVNSAVDTILYSLPLAVLFWSLCGLAAARIQPE